MGGTTNGDGGRGAADHGALRTAGFAAASSAAVLAARHMIARRSKAASSAGGGGNAAKAGVDAAWQAASDVLLPALEDAALSIGRFVGESVPEAVRERLLPRFVDGLHEALERVEGDDAEAALDET